MGVYKRMAPIYAGVVSVRGLNVSDDVGNCVGYRLCVFLFRSHDAGGPA